MDMKTKLAGLMAQCLTDTWPDVQGLPTAEEIRGLLAVPPDPKMGDYALPVFRLAKALRMAPPKNSPRPWSKSGRMRMLRVQKPSTAM